MFRGTLDITALGGAGFASQRTVDDRAPPQQQQRWDVSAYDGLRLKVLRAGGDGKKYTLTLKDEAVPKRPDGRDQSTISWEYDFVSPKEGDGGSGDQVLYIPWGDFKPTYRGKPKPDAPGLDLANVRRISLMMRRYVAFTPPIFELLPRHCSLAIHASHGRPAWLIVLHSSFFGQQEGAFRLEVAYMAAVKNSAGKAARPASVASSSSSTGYPEKGGNGGVRSEPKSWLTWMCGIFK